MKKTIAAIMFCSAIAHAGDAEEAARVIESRNIGACVEPNGRYVRRLLLRLVVSRVGTARSVQLEGGSDTEEACAQRAMEGARFPSSLAGALVEHPITSVSSLRDRPQKR